MAVIILISLLHSTSTLPPFRVVGLVLIVRMVSVVLRIIIGLLTVYYDSLREWSAAVECLGATVLVGCCPEGETFWRGGALVCPFVCLSICIVYGVWVIYLQLNEAYGLLTDDFFAVMAACSIANIVKSSLGPVGLDKMLVDDVGVSAFLSCSYCK